VSALFIHKLVRDLLHWV